LLVAPVVASGVDAVAGDQQAWAPEESRPHRR
jgi:hypothetical protein